MCWMYYLDTTKYAEFINWTQQNVLNFLHTSWAHFFFREYRHILWILRINFEKGSEEEEEVTAGTKATVITLRSR